MNFVSQYLGSVLCLFKISKIISCDTLSCFFIHHVDLHAGDTLHLQTSSFCTFVFMPAVYLRAVFTFVFVSLWGFPAVDPANNECGCCELNWWLLLIWCLPCGQIDGLTELRNVNMTVDFSKAHSYVLISLWTWLQGCCHTIERKSHSLFLYMICIEPCFEEILNQE